MKAMRGSAMMVSAVVAVLAGCATVPTQEKFEETQAEVKDRTGYDIEYNNVTAAPESVREDVNALLTDGLTAEEAAQLALLNNPRMQAVYAEYGIAVAELVEAGLLKNPVFSGEMRYLHSDVQIFEFSVVQDFLDVLLTPLRVATEKVELQQAELRLTAEVIDMATDTKRAFHEFQARAQVLELQYARLLAGEAAFEMAVKLREAGNVPQMTVARWQARYENAKLETARSEQEMAAARERLNRLMGIWGADAAWAVAGPMPQVPADDFDIVALERQALENSLDLSIAWLEIEGAARSLRIKNVEAFLPELELGIGLEGEQPEHIELQETKVGDNKSYSLEESRGHTVWGVGPAVTLPIPLFNQGQAARAGGRAEIRKRWEQHTALAIDVRSAARLAAYRLDNGRSRAAYGHEITIPVHHERMQEATLQYNGMFIGVFELLETKMDEIDAARRYIMDLRDYWRAHTDMQQILMGRAVFRDSGEHSDRTDERMGIGEERDSNE